MKKMMNFALMAVLTVGLSLAVTSCKDDDKDNGNGSGNGEPTAEELAVEHAETFWSVAANLVSPFDVTTEYENKTFEPTIGSPLDGSSTIRVVNCGSMASAASRFTSITGVEIDENTTTSTYQDDAVGTLTYTKTDNATSLATIDVNIKQIPHLQKIIFKTSEQMGTNSKFSGTAYYSFGDVIALDNEDGLQEYWVCVRPALGPAGKEDTHWVTLSQLPDKNVWTYEGKKKPITFRLPQQLGTDEIQMQNLAELLYAVCNPEQWWKNLQDNKGVDLFGDLYHERAQYFNQYFWQIVQKFWSDKSAGQSISEKLFGYDFDEMKKIINDQNALHLLRKGFSWYTTSSNSPTLYEYTYSNGTGKKSNMHSYKSKSVSKNVMTGDGIKLDCVADYTQNHWICPAFFGDEQPRFIFRFATGKDLFGADPGVFQSMKGGKHNIVDVYVLNEQLGIPTQSDLKVFTEADANPNMVTNKTADDKMGVYIPGDVVKDEQGTRWFCIMGSGYNESGKILDDRAWFISLEGISMTDGIPTNILTEAQAPEVGFRLLKIMSYVRTYQKYSVTDSKAFIAKNIYDYTKVNIGDLFVMRDSVWRFKDNKTTKYFNSHSKNLMTNLAYIGNDGELKLLRCVFDHTQAGNQRSNCQPASGKNDFQYHHFYFYKHYMNSDPSSWRELTDDESSLEMTRYMTPWPVTNDWILFSDLGNQAKVDQWAAKDKWVTLPLVDLANPGADYTKREQPRTRAYSNPRALNFVMTENGTFIDHLGMYNEPVLFVRVMTVKDAGGNKATLESEDGRKLTVVHLQDDLAWYKGMNSFVEALGAINLMKFTYLDNEPYTIDFKHGN